MTRINAGINVQLLTDQHLLAEAREIKRICYNYLKWKGQQLPDTFRLGAGHVLFFIDKGGYTLNRYKELYNECVTRGFNVTDFSNNWDVYKELNNYNPTSEAITLLIERITERIIDSKQIPKYYGRSISKEEAISLINQNK